MPKNLYLKLSGESEKFLATLKKEGVNEQSALSQALSLLSIVHKTGNVALLKPDVDEQLVDATTEYCFSIEGLPPAHNAPVPVMERYFDEERFLRRLTHIPAEPLSTRALLLAVLAKELPIYPKAWKDAVMDELLIVLERLVELQPPQDEDPETPRGGPKVPQPPDGQNPEASHQGEPQDQQPPENDKPRSSASDSNAGHQTQTRHRVEIRMKDGRIIR